MAAHGYGASEHHTQETDSQSNTADALEALTCASMEDKEAMASLTRINSTLYQSLTQVTRENYGALKAAIGIKDPVKGKDTKHRATSIGQEDKGR